MTIAEKNFLFISIWFGLRPSELESGEFRVIEEGGQKFLDVYQSKLKLLDKEERWKRIPVSEPEQHEALRLLESGHYSKPSLFKMKKAFGPETTVYGPRKGFTKLMTDRGWAFADVSRMLGHCEENTTIDHYSDHETVLKDRMRVAFGRKRA